jgi:hypothetical protein
LDDADRIIGFAAPDRRGVIENTIRHVKRAGKPVELTTVRLKKEAG